VSLQLLTPTGIVSDHSCSCLHDRSEGNNRHFISEDLGLHCTPDDRLTVKIMMALRVDLSIYWVHFTFSTFWLQTRGRGHMVEVVAGLENETFCMECQRLTRSAMFCFFVICALSVPAVVVGNRRGDMKGPLSVPDSH
jgi:hypothetical protein